MIPAYRLTAYYRDLTDDHNAWLVAHDCYSALGWIHYERGDTVRLLG